MGELQYRVIKDESQDDCFRIINTAGNAADGTHLLAICSKLDVADIIAQLLNEHATTIELPIEHDESPKPIKPRLAGFTPRVGLIFEHVNRRNEQGHSIKCRVTAITAGMVHFCDLDGSHPRFCQLTDFIKIARAITTVG